MCELQAFTPNINIRMGGPDVNLCYKMTVVNACLILIDILEMMLVLITINCDVIWS